MEKRRQSKRRKPWILGLFVLGLLTLLVLLQSSNIWKNFSVETASDTLLLYALSSLNFIAFVIFGFIFLRSIIKLARERRAVQLGSKIKTRLLIYFFAISILPIIAMAVFSYLFMNRALERWFTQIPEDVVREAREFQTKSTEERHNMLQDTARMLANTLEGRSLNQADLNELAAAGELARVEIRSAANETILSGGSPVWSERSSSVGTEPEILTRGDWNDPALSDGLGIDAAAAKLSDGRVLVLIPNLRTDETVSQMVDTSLAEFDRLKDQQITVRQIGLLTLGVLTFLLIFASTWTAFYIARGLTVPIKALAEGAGEIGRGNLGYKVEVLAEDELALLVSVFNDMSAKLEDNAAEIQDRRRYIETVLQSLPTGVISFDADNVIGTINRSAMNILKLEDADFTGMGLEAVVTGENRAVLERLLTRARRIGRASEQTNLKRERFDGSAELETSVPVALSVTAMPYQNGAVLVIEDLSELIAAQRASAWQEVARRMAHEIKNPLTPIQLSAERIAKRFAQGPAPAVRGVNDNGKHRDERSGSELGRVVDESTATILREVQSLKSMVDEFSRFARLPDASPESGDLNEVVRQVAAMYEDRFPDVRLILELGENIPPAMLDAEQMKRVFVNLLENAGEAFGEEQTGKTLSLRTRFDRARGVIIAEVSDNGVGIAPSDLQKLFQPYFSTKGRGTGLGLAIVQRIVSEHRGKIRVAGNSPTGAKFIIELPV